MPLAYALIQEEAGVAGISFPDFPGVVTTGRTAEEAIRRGSEALSSRVRGMAEGGGAIPMLRSIAELRADPEFVSGAADAVVALVPFDLPARAVRINVSMDEHLLRAIDRAAAASGQSRSAFIADAARLKLRS